MANDLDKIACVFTKDLGVTDYQSVFADMQAYTRGRTPDSADKIWLTEHAPVFTQGQAGKPEHVLAPGDIPVIQSDRGGQSDLPRAGANYGLFAVGPAHQKDGGPRPCFWN